MATRRRGGKVVAWPSRPALRGCDETDRDAAGFMNYLPSSGCAARRAIEEAAATPSLGLSVFSSAG
jgi:hypothetical protein